MPVQPCRMDASHASLKWRAPERGPADAADAVAKETTVSQKQKAPELARAAVLLARDDEACRQVFGQLWDAAFEEGRLDALDEFQDRFCVCMK
jgi:hypothetical protein